jgi:hypothetical protein
VPSLWPRFLSADKAKETNQNFYSTKERASPHPHPSPPVYHSLIYIYHLYSIIYVLFFQAFPFLYQVNIFSHCHQLFLRRFFFFLKKFLRWFYFYHLKTKICINIFFAFFPSFIFYFFYLVQPYRDEGKGNRVVSHF